MAVILLSNGTECLVDDSDLELVSRHSWCPSSNGFGKLYAQTRYKTKILSMHRLLMNAPKGTMVDHINGNSLDNRRENLRFVTRSQNALNSKPRKKKFSAHRGVTFDVSRGRWVAQLKVEGVKLLHKRFDTEAEAAVAYRDAVKTSGASAYVPEAPLS